ncbi:MAG TPA: hypothetical protein VF084_12690 [Nitrososphaeraceae archaeon]
MTEKSTISDDYKEIGTSNITSSNLEQGSEANHQRTDINESIGYESKPVKNKISGKVPGSLTEVAKEGKNAINKTFSFGDQQDRSKGFKSIILGLFALIGFIILVYSIFIAVIGEPLASVADTVFIAALIGSFTLVATIISHQFIKR